MKLKNFLEDILKGISDGLNEANEKSRSKQTERGIVTSKVYIPQGYSMTRLVVSAGNGVTYIEKSEKISEKYILYLEKELGKKKETNPIEVSREDFTNAELGKPYR